MSAVNARRLDRGPGTGSGPPWEAHWGIRGASDGSSLGSPLGSSLGASLGAPVGAVVGPSSAADVGADVGAPVVHAATMRGDGSEGEQGQPPGSSFHPSPVLLTASLQRHARRSRLPRGPAPGNSCRTRGSRARPDIRARPARSERKPITGHSRLRHPSDEVRSEVRAVRPPSFGTLPACRAAASWRWPRSRRGSATSRRTWSATARSSRRRGSVAPTWSSSRSSGLTGYLLQDLNAEVAMRRDDPRLASLAAETQGLSAVVSFVEESDDHRLFISAALLEDGARPSRPSQGLPAHLRALRRAPLLRAGRSLRADAQPPRAAPRASASARTSGTWPRRSCWRSTARRCSSTSRRRRAGTWPPSTRTGLGHRQLVADPQPRRTRS